MKKIISIIILVILVLIIWTVAKKPKSNNIQNTNTEIENVVAGETPNQASSTPLVSPISSIAKTYKLADVATHNKDGDCWTTVGGKVYDLTTWPEKHPGGDKAIFAICGIDGTTAYEKAHKGQPDPKKVLDGFYIGELQR
jgi:cytochrome b involved in lipid metabolism